MAFTPMYSFKTARFEVEWAVEQDYGYQYDGDDEDGSIQAALEDGSMVAFDSRFTVALDGVVIAENYLGGSVYREDEVATFRDHVGARGKWGSYFTGFIRETIAEARKAILTAPAKPFMRAAR